MTGDTTLPSEEFAPVPGVSAGARLRDARFAAGLSIDAVAQQLKLHPRQVQALENDDYAQLPGRTFVRGFMRNYARLLQLNADDVLATLPDASSTPSLDRPSLTPTTRVMGELPADAHGKPSNARWAIPLALVAIVAIAVAYQFARPLAEQARGVLGDKPASSSAVPLPNPAPAAAPNNPATSSVQPTEVPPAPTESTSSGNAATSASVTPSTTAAITGETPLVLVFRGTSWVEVKDAKGAIVLSTIGYPGATHSVGGLTPLEIVLGNAEAVAVTWRGAPFDSVPFIKQNVAKFSVK